MAKKNDYPDNPFFDWIDEWSSNKANIDLLTLFKQSSDAFNKIIADSTTNTLDLPSTYNFSSERYRIGLNGTTYRRIGDVSQVVNGEGSFLLQPEMGDNVRLRSAERPRYVVQYESIASASIKLQDALESGDRVEVGLNDFQSPENAAFFEFNGDGTYRAVVIGKGNEVMTDTFELPDGVSLTDALRLEIEFNWYNVGRYLFSVSFTDSSRPEGEKQRKEILTELTLDGDFATGDPNMHLFAEFNSMYSGKTLEVGSFGYIVLGDTTPTSRTKLARLTGLSYSGTGDYEALAALRVEPPEGTVYVELSDLTVVPQTGEGEMIAISVSENDTDASGWSYPPEHGSTNTVVEYTTNVTEFPDSTGSIVTSTSNPNGYQLGFSSSDVVGQGSTSRVSEITSNEKRPIYEDDVVIFLYKADSALSSTVNFGYSTTQEW